MNRRHSHYFKNVETLDHIDVYRVLVLFQVTDPCLQHAIKKLLVAGGRGNKDLVRDVMEAKESLERWHEMRVEDDMALEHGAKMANVPVNLDGSTFEGRPGAL